MRAPTLKKDGQKPSSSDTPNSNALRNQFTVMALNMSWQLAIVVLIPIIGGVELDKAIHAGSVCLFIGLTIAVLGSIAVMWRTVQIANQLPVPKLTEAQKREIRKSYEDEEND
jgi:hypothetical protein